MTDQWVIEYIGPGPLRGQFWKGYTEPELNDDWGGSLPFKDPEHWTDSVARAHRFDEDPTDWLTFAWHEGQWTGEDISWYKLEWYDEEESHV